MMLAAWQGREQEASELIQATMQEAATRRTGGLVGFAANATAVLHDLRRYDAARDAVREVFERDELALGPLVVTELAEAAARTGDVALVQATLDWLSERTPVPPPRGRWASRPGSALCSAGGKRPTATTASRSSG